MNWTYVQPVEIRMRSGALRALGDILKERGYDRGVLVCDPFFAKSGLAEAVIGYADGRIAGVYSDVTPNPRVREVDECARALRDADAQFAVALGGGSAMDCAKAACAIARTGQSAAIFHTGGVKLPGDAIPLIAVPTTAGTGSEVTMVAVLTDDVKNVKAPLGHPSLFPKLALIDPELTLSLPPKATASTALDALSHALEGFWSRGHQPICDALALHAARKVFEALPKVLADGGDLAAREALCEASVIAGLAFALPKTAASHAISFPLTNVYGLPHGEACAFTLDSLCGINAEAEGGRLNDFARNLGFDEAHAMGARIAALKKLSGMRSTLKDAGIPVSALPELVRLSHHPNLDNNPVPLSDEDLMRLFLSKEV
jgi:alcohol dehydrogenase